MITIYSSKHSLRNAKTELYGGELVRPFERPERMDYIIDEIKNQNLGEIKKPKEIDFVWCKRKVYRLFEKEQFFFF